MSTASTEQSNAFLKEIDFTPSGAESYTLCYDNAIEAMLYAAEIERFPTVWEVSFPNSLYPDLPEDLHVYLEEDRIVYSAGVTLPVDQCPYQDLDIHDLYLLYQEDNAGPINIDLALICLEVLVDQASNTNFNWVKEIQSANPKMTIQHMGYLFLKIIRHFQNEV